MDKPSLVAALTAFCHKDGSFTHAKSEWCRMLQNLMDGRAIHWKINGRCGVETFRALKADGFFVSIGKKSVDPDYLLVIQK